MILLEKNRGFSLVELLIVLAIFSVILAVVFSSYITQVKHTGREYRVAEAEMEVGIARGIIERDIAMVGYGIAEDYSSTTFDPRVASATNAAVASGWDELFLRGTAIGTGSRVAQGWSYISATTPTFATWADARENLVANAGGIANADDVVIIMEPGTKKLLIEDVTGVKMWLFRYNGPSTNITTLTGDQPLTNPTVGTLLYGLHRADDATPATFPYFTVRYYKGSGGSPSNCATGTESLLRAESNTTETPSGAGVANPLLACVRDVEVAFGLDTNEDGTIDTWDNGGVTATGYDAGSLRKRLKQIRMYILIQSGNYDSGYTSPSPIWVGDPILSTGRDVTLTTAQLNYRWKMLAISVTPRNIR